jgi:hypothetical protein
MDQYQNRDGVTVQAELVADGEYEGFWHTIDANGVEGHVTDELFQYNFTRSDDTAKKPAAGK